MLLNLYLQTPLDSGVYNLADPNPTLGVTQSEFARSQKSLPRILILGGTGEGSELALHLANRQDVCAISSLAGRVAEPKRPVGIVRVGGFGGVDGLASFLVNERIEMVVDATHPFATRISRNAELACAGLGLPLISFIRPPWVKTEADLWHEVQDSKEAAYVVGSQKKRALLSIGRQEVDSFTACHNAWFLIRAIEKPTGRLPRLHEILLRRGPISLDEELKLLEDYSIDCMISKNSGGLATYPKIQAAQLLKIPVIMIKRPVKHTVPAVETVEEVLTKVDWWVKSTGTTR